MDTEHRIVEYWVYIAECSDGSLYTGMTSDVERRIDQHNAGTGAKYTRARRPVICVYRERCISRSDALKREAQIKKLSRAEKQVLVGTMDQRQRCQA